MLQSKSVAAHSSLDDLYKVAKGETTVKEEQFKPISKQCYEIAKALAGFSKALGDEAPIALSHSKEAVSTNAQGSRSRQKRSRSKSVKKRQKFLLSLEGIEQDDYSDADAANKSGNEADGSDRTSTDSDKSLDSNLSGYDLESFDVKSWRTDVLSLLARFQSKAELQSISTLQDGSLNKNIDHAADLLHIEALGDSRDSEMAMFDRLTDDLRESVEDQEVKTLQLLAKFNASLHQTSQDIIASRKHRRKHARKFSFSNMKDIKLSRAALEEKEDDGVQRSETIKSSKSSKAKSSAAGPASELLRLISEQQASIATTQAATVIQQKRQEVLAKSLRFLQQYDDTRDQDHLKFAGKQEEMPLEVKDTLLSIVGEMLDSGMLAGYGRQEKGNEFSRRHSVVSEDPTNDLETDVGNLEAEIVSLQSQVTGLKQSGKGLKKSALLQNSSKRSASPAVSQTMTSSPVSKAKLQTHSDYQAGSTQDSFQDEVSKLSGADIQVAEKGLAQFETDKDTFLRSIEKARELSALLSLPGQKRGRFETLLLSALPDMTTDESPTKAVQDGVSSLNLAPALLGSVESKVSLASQEVEQSSPSRNLGHHASPSKHQEATRNNSHEIGKPPRAQVGEAYAGKHNNDEQMIGTKASSNLKAGAKALLEHQQHIKQMEAAIKSIQEKLVSFRKDVETAQIGSQGKDAKTPSMQNSLLADIPSAAERRKSVLEALAVMVPMQEQQATASPAVIAKLLKAKGEHIELTEQIKRFDDLSRVIRQRAKNLTEGEVAIIKKIVDPDDPELDVVKKSLAEERQKIRSMQRQLKLKRKTWAGMDNLSNVVKSIGFTNAAQTASASTNKVKDLISAGLVMQRLGQLEPSQAENQKGEDKPAIRRNSVKLGTEMIALQTAAALVRQIASPQRSDGTAMQENLSESQGNASQRPTETFSQVRQQLQEQFQSIVADGITKDWAGKGAPQKSVGNFDQVRKSFNLRVRAQAVQNSDKSSLAMLTVGALQVSASSVAPTKLSTSPSRMPADTLLKTSPRDRRQQAGASTSTSDFVLNASAVKVPSSASERARFQPLHRRTHVHPRALDAALQNSDRQLLVEPFAVVANSKLVTVGGRQASPGKGVPAEGGTTHQDAFHKEEEHPRKPAAEAKVRFGGVETREVDTRTFLSPRRLVSQNSSHQIT